jgi:hypothetical protein
MQKSNMIDVAELTILSTLRRGRLIMHQDAILRSG